MKQTVLHQKHLQANAKLTEFQGWQVPLQFSDVQEEYHAVRTSAGLFDVSFLGRIEVSGAGASDLLQRIVTRDMEKIAEGSAHYGLICNEEGLILADALIFRLPGETSGRRYLLSTSAVNTQKILLWLKKYATNDVRITDETETIAQVSLQGPQSFPLLEKLAGTHFRKIKPRAVREITVLDAELLVSRTGYTGEHGYELFVPVDRAVSLWDAILTAGGDLNILPCGLSCREILRLERGYPLYGNDIDETRTPLEAGLASFVCLKKEFIGRDALLRIKAEGVKQKLVGFVLFDKGIPKNGGSIFSENHEIGVVTSGGQSPHLRSGIGLGYVASRYAQAGQEIEIEVKDREISAKIMDLPFYRKK